MKHQHSFYKILTLILSLTISTPTIGAEKEHISKPQSESKEVVHKPFHRPLIYGYIREIYGSLLPERIIQLISQYTLLRIQHSFTINEDLTYTLGADTMASLGNNKIMVIFRERENPLIIIDLKTKEQSPYSIQLDKSIHEKPTSIAFSHNPVQKKGSTLLIGTNKGIVYHIIGTPWKDKENLEKPLKFLLKLKGSIHSITQNPYNTGECVIMTRENKACYINLNNEKLHVPLHIRKSAKIDRVHFANNAICLLAKDKETFIYIYERKDILNHTLESPLSSKKIKVAGKKQKMWNHLGMVEQCEKGYRILNRIGAICEINGQSQREELNQAFVHQSKGLITWLPLPNNQYLSITSITDRQNNGNNTLAIWQKKGNTFSRIDHEIDSLSQGLTAGCLYLGSYLILRTKDIIVYKMC